MRELINCGRFKIKKENFVNAQKFFETSREEVKLSAQFTVQTESIIRGHVRVFNFRNCRTDLDEIWSIGPAG